jgi:2-dehydro-3-deoxyphosphooctonate aldolase (KDO 8-P synthase)
VTVAAGPSRFRTPRGSVRIGADVVVGDGGLVVFAGPCALESRDLVFEVVSELDRICTALGLSYVFKTSFDKANRTSIGSFRSVGFDPALAILAELREAVGVPVMTDIHETHQVSSVAGVADVLQIPAFLCRQTDLLVAAGASGRTVNIKKGQFMAADDMRYAVAKVRGAGGPGVLLTERGSTFGYHDLVVDFRSLAIMRRFAPVVFDATHSVQSPGGGLGRSGGHRQFVAPLARAAVAFGVDAVFLETHPDPDSALSDGPSMVPLRDVEPLLRECQAIHAMRRPVKA